MNIDLEKLEKNKERLEQYREKGQTFCPYLFVHYHLDTDKASKLCCHASRNISDSQIDFMDPLYNDLRKKSLDNEKLPGCDRCYKAEENGFTSLRQRCIDDHTSAISKTGHLINSIDDWTAGKDIQPVWYDLRISNNCNLSCIMCGPHYSSTWAKELNQENTHLLYEPDIEINPDSVKIQLAGGEPFMIKKFVKILEQVEDFRCEVVVNTNATIVTKPLLDELKRFRNVQIVVSIDGAGEVNDKIRKGSNWETIKQNIKLFQDCGFTVLVNTVLQKDNINHIYELGIELENLGIDDWIIMPLFVPEQLKWNWQKNINYEGIKKTAELYSVRRNENSLTLLQHILLKEKT